MRERRGARIGTVSGLALLAGGTAIAAVAGGAHSVFASLLLGLLALGMGHSLLVEIRRQARRRSARWACRDTVNAVLLGCWAEAAMITTILKPDPVSVRAVAMILTIAYAGACGYFVTERRRTVATAQPKPEPSPVPTAPPAASAAVAGTPATAPAADLASAPATNLASAPATAPSETPASTTTPGLAVTSTSSTTTAAATNPATGPTGAPTTPDAATT